jgi:RNA polymerase sigma-70 factor (ECF subfamily)
VADVEFERLVEAHYASLYRFGLSLSRSESEACDLVQQTFLHWAAKGHQLREPAKARSWLLTTLHREFLRARRHEARFPHHEMSEVAAELPAIAPTMMDELDSGAAMRALLQVDEVFRVPLSLFYLEDLSYKEIAAFLDVPAGTVMSRLARGKAQLRDLLAVGPEAADAPVRKTVTTPENCHG